MSDVYPGAHAAPPAHHRDDEGGGRTLSRDDRRRHGALRPARARVGSTQGSTHLRGTISGEDAFRLYDTYGFPIDLTELMARERGYTVDIAGFEAALAQQRSQSQAERKSRKLGVGADDFADLTAWRSCDA